MNDTEVLEIINQATEDLRRDEVEVEGFTINDSPLTDEEMAILEQTVEEAHMEIPTNSASLLIDEATSRFSSAIWYERIKSKIVLLAGVGGIGSYVGFLLARMRVATIFLYDPDIVETANMSGQLYSASDVGMHKVDALSRMVGNYANYYSALAISERFTEDTESSDIMICGFDNMAARKLYFNKWKSHVLSKPESDRNECLFNDADLGHV